MNDNLCENDCIYSRIIERKYAGDIKAIRTIYCEWTNEIIRGAVVECQKTMRK